MVIVTDGATQDPEIALKSAETAKTVIMDAVKNYKKILKKY